MKIYIVFNASVEDRLEDVVKETDLAQYKERKWVEMEKSIRKEYKVVHSLERFDNLQEWNGVVCFGVHAIVSRKNGDTERYIEHQEMKCGPMKMWQPSMHTPT